MKLSFTVDEVTEKEADDLADEIISILIHELGVMVTDYFVEEA